MKRNRKSGLTRKVERAPKSSPSACCVDQPIPERHVEWISQVKEWLVWRWRHWRWKEALVVGSVLIPLIVWFHWKETGKLPGMHGFIEWLTRESLPQADPHRFSIAIAHLEDDPNHEVEKLIFESLSEISGSAIQILRFDRLITTEGSDSNEIIDNGHAYARELLDRSHAQVLIWGTVLRSVPKLHWTVNKQLEGFNKFGRHPVSAGNLDLPPMVLEDVQNLLLLLTLSEAAEYSREDGAFIADRLKPFIGLVQYLIRHPVTKDAWSNDERSLLSVSVGDALATYGYQKGDPTALAKAVTAYHAALEEVTRERAPLQWTRTQNNLGVVLRALGERKSGTARLEEAVTAFRAALEEVARERAPLQWALTQNNLGTALSAVGKRGSGTAQLEEAVMAYQRALSVFEAENISFYIEKTRRNLDRTRRILAVREAH